MTMINICKKLKQKVYDRNEVIMKKGEIGDEMVVVLIGELGVIEEGSAHMLKLTENMAFGERVLRIREPWKQTLIS